MADSNVDIIVNADTSNANNGLNQLNNQLNNTQDQLNNTSSASQNMGAKLTAIGSSMASVGTAMTAAITLPLIGLAVASVKLASDFNENSNKVDVIFKKNSESVKTWAKGMIDGFGIAEGSALNMVSIFGDMATSMGVSQDESARMSERLVELAGDLASFKNIGIDQAQTALQGIFTGEGEALKSLGIVMTVANLEAFALAKGTKKVYKEMSEASKIALRYDYILSVTTSSQGDFKRTQDALANSVRSLMERLKELSVAFGQELIPVVTPVVNKLGLLIKMFTGLSPAMKRTYLTIALITAIIPPLVVGLGMIVMAVGAIMSVGLVAFGWIALAVVGFVALVAGAVLLTQYFMGSAIPAIDLYGETTSKTTKKAVGDYDKLDKSASLSLKSLELNGGKISKSMASTLIKNFGDMGTQIKLGMDKHNAEMLAGMTKLFGDSSVLSTAEEAKRVKAATTSNEARKKEVDKYTKEEQEIIKAGLKQKEGLTLSQQDRLGELQRLQKETAITYLSATEVESTAIRQRMKDAAGTLATEELATVVRGSMANRDAQIKGANETFDGKLASIIRMRDESKIISAEEANGMIMEANKQRDLVVASARQQHDGVVGQAKLQAQDHATEVDWETGQIRTKWDMFSTGVIAVFDNMGNTLVEKGNIVDAAINQAVANMKQGVIDKFAQMKANVIGNVASIKEAASRQMSQMKSNFQTNVASIKNYFSQGFADIVSGILNKLASITGRVNSFKAGFKNLFAGVHIPTFSFSGSMNPVKWKTEGMPQVHMNAKGGIFKSPTLLGGNNVVGEAGSEAIIPLSNKSAVQPFAKAVASQFKALQPDNNQSDRNNRDKGVVITGNSFVVREEADITKIAEKLLVLQERNRRGKGGHPVV